MSLRILVYIMMFTLLSTMHVQAVERYKIAPDIFLVLVEFRDTPFNRTINGEHFITYWENKIFIDTNTYMHDVGFYRQMHLTPADIVIRYQKDNIEVNPKSILMKLDRQRPMEGRTGRREVINEILETLQTSFYFNSDTYTTDLMFYFIISGYGEDGSIDDIFSIWSHARIPSSRSNNMQIPSTINGRIVSYATQGEFVSIFGRTTSHAIAAHEIFHLLGLDDLVGNHSYLCIMGGGVWGSYSIGTLYADSPVRLSAPNRYILGLGDIVYVPDVKHYEGVITRHSVVRWNISSLDRFLLIEWRDDSGLRSVSGRNENVWIVWIVDPTRHRRFTVQHVEWTDSRHFHMTWDEYSITLYSIHLYF